MEGTLAKCVHSECVCVWCACVCDCWGVTTRWIFAKHLVQLVGRHKRYDQTEVLRLLTCDMHICTSTIIYTSKSHDVEPQSPPQEVMLHGGCGSP